MVCSYFSDSRYGRFIVSERGTSLIPIYFLASRWSLYHPKNWKVFLHLTQVLFDISMDKIYLMMSIDKIKYFNMKAFYLDLTEDKHFHLYVLESLIVFLLIKGRRKPNKMCWPTFRSTTCWSSFWKTMLSVWF